MYQVVGLKSRFLMSLKPFEDRNRKDSSYELANTQVALNHETKEQSTSADNTEFE